MTITYADGSAAEGLFLSLAEEVMKVAIAGEDDVRILTRVDGRWRAENGEEVQLRYAWQHDQPAPAPAESHFICSKELADQLITILMNGSELQDGYTSPHYVFSAERRRVRITVVRGQYRR